jgi:hypothetical protein
MATVPIELIIKILENAYYKEALHPDPDYTTLCACALVCPAWSSYAQQLLFRFVSLCIRDDDDERAELRNESFLQAIDSSTDRGRTLASWVRNLSVVLSVTTHDASISPTILFNILTSCSRLYELTIETRGLYELNANHLAKFKDIAPNITIRSVKLLRASVQSPILCQLLSIWPSVQFLTVGTEMVTSPPPKPCNLQLYELVLRRTPTEALLEWFLSTSLNTLRVLSLFDPPSQTIRSILSKYAPHLQSLRLFHYNLNTIAFLRLCMNLEELILVHVPDHFVAENLPASIEHFGFSDVARKSLKRVVSAVLKLPNLRVLSCNPKIKSLSGFHELQAVCVDKGVDLRVEPRRLMVSEH